MAKIIVHIDLNAFFARCEEIKNPSLEKLPIAVGGKGRRGIISTCNYEARKYGVKSAIPTYQAKRLCPNLVICPSDFAFYHRKSQEFMNFVRRHSPILEIASVDECYVDMTDVLKDVKDVEQYFLDFQNRLFEETKLYCSVGIGPTKFLAKMASDMKKPRGITILRRRDLKVKLHPLPIDEMWGIGKKSAPKLKEIGILTIGDLVKDNSYEAKQILGKFYYVLKDWALGKGDDHVEVEPFDPKSIGHSTTLNEDTANIEEILSVLKELARDVSSEAKEKHKKGTTVQIVIKYNDFKVNNRSITIDEPFNDYETLYGYAMKLFQKHFTGQEIRLIGVTLQNLQDERDIVVQMSLFNYQQHEEESATKLLISELNRKFDKPLLKRASDIKK